MQQVARCSDGRIKDYHCVEARHSMIADGWARDVICLKCTKRVLPVLVMLDEYASQGTDIVEARERRNREMGELDQHLVEAGRRERGSELQEPVRQSAEVRMETGASEGGWKDAKSTLEGGEPEEEERDDRPWLEGIMDHADATSDEEERAEAGDELSTATAKLGGRKAKGKVLGILDILQDNLRKETARKLQRTGGLRHN